MEQYLYQDLYQLEDFHWWHRAKRELVVKNIKKLTNQIVNKPKILDIGCGAGKNLETFTTIGEAWGIDISPEAVKYCKARGLKNVKLGSAYDLPFTKGTFNIVTLLDVLEHVDEEKALFETGRVLEDDGYLIINVPAFDFLWSQWDVVLHHERRYTKESLTNVLNNNGFEVISQTYVFSFLVLPALLIRSTKSKRAKPYGSDFTLNHPLLNNLFLTAARLEQWLMNILPIPFGTSLFCLAKKK